MENNDSKNRGSSARPSSTKSGDKRSSKRDAQKRKSRRRARHRKLSYEEMELLTRKRRTKVTDKPVDREFYVDERKPISNKEKANKATNKKSSKKEKSKKSKPPMSKKSRKILNIIICSVIIVIVISVGVVLSLTVLFRTENITAEDSKHYTGNQIVASCGIEYGENLFTSDKATAEAKIEKELPYVETAEINIKIPDTLVIEVIEAKPAYVIESRGEFIVISGEGKVLEKTSKNILDIPLVKVNGKVEATEGMIVKFEKDYILESIVEINKSITENKFYGIEEINIESSTNITLNYSNRIKIILGLPIDINYKIITAKEIIEQKLSKSDIGVLDVSNCNEDIKASYFNPDPTVFEEEASEESGGEEATQPVTEATTEEYTEEYTESYTEGYTEEYTEGYTEEYTESYTEGYTEGYTESYAEEYTESYTEDSNSYTDSTSIDDSNYY